MFHVRLVLFGQPSPPHPASANTLLRCPLPQTSSELLEEEGHFDDDVAASDYSRNPLHASSGGGRPKQLVSRNSLSASFSTATTPTTLDHQHDPQHRNRRPSPTFPAMPEVANSRSYEGPDAAGGSAAGGDGDGDASDGGSGDDVYAQGGGVARAGGAGGSWAVDTLSEMSGSFTTESDMASSTGPGGTWCDDAHESSFWF